MPSTDLNALAPGLSPTPFPPTKPQATKAVSESTEANIEDKGEEASNLKNEKVTCSWDVYALAIPAYTLNMF